MPKDYTPYATHHAPAKAVSSGFGDVRDQFTASDEMRAATLSHMLHKAEAKIAILELRIKYHETHPLLVAYERLTATGASLVFVGEIVRGDTPRIQAAGELLSVLETLGARHAVFERQVVELKTETKTKAS